VGPAGQRRRGTRGSAEAARRAAGPAKLGRRLAALGRAMRKWENRLGLALRKKGRWASARAERKGEQRPGKGNGPRGKKIEQARNKGRRKNLFFSFSNFFQSKFKMKSQLNSKSDFKPSNTKNYATS